MSIYFLRNSVYVALLLSVASTNAEICKWVNQNGQVRYSDKKPNRIELGSLTRNVKEKQERSKDKI
ncbi:DUF4124 domain-containing protein [Microbulbifer sp. GL-2]|uniref:DUF4124 domain-containing protein n=1 Tax=Microbulbifer sp. GL-2 TaxID=2591606 RepID=UPI0011652A8F|nr:hypothetical protein GL2_34070 [Microbulbifer sp. GL-2]